MSPCRLDTDILSEILKQKNTNVVQNASWYLQQHGQFVFSAFTRYEILRGLKLKHAAAQLQRFETFCQHSLILPLDDAVLLRAADLWVAVRQGGRPGRDADLMIAATALEHGRELVTGNVTHFSWIAGLVVKDWRQP